MEQVIDPEWGPDLTNTFSSDADRDALRRVADAGADLSRPMSIEFHVRAPDRRSAELAATKVAALGYVPDIESDEGSDNITLYCARQMLATLENVVNAQAELNDAVSPFGAECDGWGTFGN